jgi:hypothetical protein
MESNIYNKFSEEYDQLFYNQIIDFKTKLFQKYETQFVDFYPSFGIKPGQRCDFIIYGQALNGWGASFNVNENDLDIKTRVAESIEYSNSYYAKKNHCPLDWVNVYWSPKNYSEYASNAEEKAFYDPVTIWT